MRKDEFFRKTTGCYRALPWALSPRAYLVKGPQEPEWE